MNRGSLTVAGLALLLVGCSVLRNNDSRTPPRAENGFIDLAQWNFQTDGDVPLQGRWAFYWKQLLSAKEIHSPDANSLYIDLPSRWGTATLSDGSHPEPTGYATFVLEFSGLNSDEMHHLAMRLKDTLTAYELSVVSEGREYPIMKNGVVGTDASSSVPQHLPQIRPIPSSVSSGYFVLRVSNFHDGLGGPIYPIVLGTEHSLLMDSRARRSTDFLILGVLLIMALYHLGLFSQRTRDRSALWFALFNAVIALRMLLTEKYIQEAFPVPDVAVFEVLMKFDYATGFIGLPLFFSFLRSVFFAPAQKWVERVSWIVCGVFLLTLAWPQRTYSPISVYYYGWTLLLCLWILFSLAGAIRKRKLGSLVSFLALIFLFLAVANDTLLSQGWIRSGYLFPYVFILFVLGQSYILIRRFTAAFNTAEHLTDNLKFEVRQRTRELAEKNDRLHAITRQQREFFHNVSHELRTPLTLIYGPLQSLKAGEYGEVPESMNQPLELMLRSGRRLQRLINQLLDLARLEAGFLRLNLEIVNLGKLIEEVIQPFLPLAEKKGVSLKFKAQPDLICSVDPDKMDKVLYNLISNALKYTKTGGIIRLSVGVDNDQLRIRISDSGPGIPAESLPRIFDRFYQVDDSRPTEREGTGIGLAIVSEFVKMHDGTISVDSEPGVGSSFLIVLPRRLGEESANNRKNPLAPASGSEESMERDAPSQANLMIVEDSPDMRDFITHILRGYNLTVAENGLEALQLARENPPDAILSDLMMPEMDGLEFLSRLKSEPSLSSIPFAMLTARSDPEDENEGADFYLQKPFRPEALRDLVRKMTASAPRE